MQRTVILAVSRETRREEAVALFLQTPQMELKLVRMRAHTVGCDDPVIQPPSPGRGTSHRPHVETGLRPESSSLCARPAVE